MRKFKRHTKISRPSFEEREIWWYHLGLNVGDEENGKGENFTRPVIIIKKFNANFCLAIPLSTKIKDNKYYYQTSFGGKNQSILVSQIRTIDVKRLRTKMDKLDSQSFQSLKNYCKDILF